jgi:hypothetical protein
MGMSPKSEDRDLEIEGLIRTKIFNKNWLFAGVLYVKGRGKETRA